MPTSDITLQKVYQLYALQAEFVKMLETKNIPKKERMLAKKKLRDYSTLLEQVKRKHRGYLGGDDVLMTLEFVRDEMKRALAK